MQCHAENFDARHFHWGLGSGTLLVPGYLLGAYRDGGDVQLTTGRLLSFICIYCADVHIPFPLYMYICMKHNLQCSHAHIPLAGTTLISASRVYNGWAMQRHNTTRIIEDTVLMITNRDHFVSHVIVSPVAAGIIS